MLEINHIDELATEWAVWYNGDKTSGKRFRCKTASEQERKYVAIGGNINDSATDVVIETRYPYEFKTDDHIYYRGKWWLIDAVSTNTDDIQPQAIGFAPINRVAVSYLRLIGTRWDI